MPLRQRLHLPGLLMVLFALSVQLGVGSRVPQIDPLIQELATLCQASAAPDQSPHQAPAHPMDCLLCPLCMTVHVASAWILPQAVVILVPVIGVAERPELPPPSRAPPPARRYVAQPRAPPAHS
jgi:hypothetical protein